MMPRSRLRAGVTQAAFRALALYRPARDYVMQMKWKPAPRFDEGLVCGTAGAALRGRMFIQPRVESRAGDSVLLDALLGPGFAVLEWHDGTLPNAGARADRALDARVVQVIPRDHRFVASSPSGSEQVRDSSGAIAAIFESAAIRGVVLRPDRYVAACIPRDAGEDAADVALETIQRITQGGLP
jgi:3-(3-hydroxy-phenyl)propionate hydroxylase